MNNFSLFAESFVCVYIYIKVKLKTKNGTSRNPANLHQAAGLPKPVPHPSRRFQLDWEERLAGFSGRRRRPKPPRGNADTVWPDGGTFFPFSSWSEQ